MTNLDPKLYPKAKVRLLDDGAPGNEMLLFTCELTPEALEAWRLAGGKWTHSIPLRDAERIKVEPGEHYRVEL